MSVRLVPASPAHVGVIATRIRAIDAAECGAFGSSPKAALRNGIMGSTMALTALVDGRPEAMLGVCPANMLEGRGTAWMLGTDVVYQQGRALLQLAGPVLGAFHRDYRRLENWVSEENRPAIRLLKRWGFSVGDEKRDIGGFTFLPFWREQK